MYTKIILTAAFMTLSQIVVAQNDFLAKLKSADWKFSTFTMGFEFREPGLSFDPDQGIKISDSKITVSPNAVALQMINSFDREPTYKNEGYSDYRPYDYNPNGDLIIWRTLAKYAVSDETENVSMQELQSCNVSELRKLTKLAPRFRQTVFDLGSEDNVYESVHILLGAGRGFSRFVEAVDSIHELPGGLVEIIGKGNFGPAISGNWTLMVDIENSDLIRKAKFTPTGNSMPYLTIETEGTVAENGLVVAKKGVLAFSFPSNYQFLIEVRPKSVSGLFDGDFYAKMKAEVKKSRPQMKVLDLRKAR